MAVGKLTVKWSSEAIADLKSIYYYLLRKNSNETALKIRNEIFEASRNIVFPEQYQVDDIYNKYRRIVIRNYKILYSTEAKNIHITTVINCHNDTL